MEREDRITPSREDCVYTSCYCEENVWKLCEFVRSERTAPLEELFVVFISNENRKVPLWKQRSGHGEQPVIWVCDVTVIDNNCDVIDCSKALNCMLPRPCARTAPFNLHTTGCCELSLLTASF
uniref:Protein N-terminal glutamine amidohydrolase n=1 Tax=Gasterosteus aculeatus aculeatus TaxID=481459 RepID=G3P837_GASAC